MAKAIQTMAASLAHAAWTKQPAQIGGGSYDATECGEAARALESFPKMLAALRDVADWFAGSLDLPEAEILARVNAALNAIGGN